MSDKKAFTLGLIEGFFGRSWSWQSRHSYADFLSENGFNSYIYAPKSDLFFRKEWYKTIPLEHLQKLHELAQTYQSKQLEFGVGLSPFELYRDFNQAQQQLLKNKLAEINSLEGNILCILFDDMQGDFPDLAQRQTDIMHFVAEHSQASHLIFCPTYYSYDPLLASHFGEMPDNYLEDIGRLLDPAVNIFWTGPKIFSREYPQEHLLELTEKFNRKPLIWDNYPVNDSKKLTAFLNLRAFDQDSFLMEKLSSGHIVNPMNEAALSQIPLYSLAKMYQLKENYDPDIVIAQACYALCSENLAKIILEDLSLFQDIGLDEMTDNIKQNLIEKYTPYKSESAGREIIEWLQGRYEFDPACLS